MRMTNKREPVNRAGIWLIVFSLPYLVLAVVGFAGYMLFNTQLDSLLADLGSLPSEITSSFSGIDQILSTLETIILGISLISLFIWLLMVILGVINLRRT